MLLRLSDGNAGEDFGSTGQAGIFQRGLQRTQIGEDALLGRGLGILYFHYLSPLIIQSSEHRPWSDRHLATVLSLVFKTLY